MTDRILQKYTGRAADAGADSPSAGESEGAEDLGAFGWLRGVRDRAVMLELRKKTGTVLAIGYGWIERVEFDPSDGITLHAAGQTIRIRGRNLNAGARAQARLFHGITRHRVPWVQEADEADRLRAGDDAVVVESIEW